MLTNIKGNFLILTNIQGNYLILKNMHGNHFILTNLRNLFIVNGQFPKQIWIASQTQIRLNLQRDEKVKTMFNVKWFGVYKLICIIWQSSQVFRLLSFSFSAILNFFQRILVLFELIPVCKLFFSSSQTINNIIFLVG